MKNSPAILAMGKTNLAMIKVAIAVPTIISGGSHSPQELTDF